VKSVKKYGFFDVPFGLFKEKKFSSLRRDHEPFWELKRSKTEETAQYLKKRIFIKKDLRFSLSLPKCYATHRKYEILSKSLVPLGE
jgi:hypothetical protein